MASTASPAKKKTALTLERIFSEVASTYPDLKADEIYAMILEIKKQNNGTLKSLSVNDIVARVGDLKGMYTFWYRLSSEHLFVIDFFRNPFFLYALLATNIFV